jgi:hypothetical protein
VEVISLGLLFVDAQTPAVLPDVAPFAGNTVFPVVNLSMQSADAVECPILFFLQLLECLLVLLDLRLQAAL